MNPNAVKFVWPEDSVSSFAQESEHQGEEPRRNLDRYEGPWLEIWIPPLGVESESGGQGEEIPPMF